MGERKVLNKYFPPDFDPKDVPRTKKAQDEQMKVRMMLPMSVRCQTCGTFMYKGTKFTTRKEDVIGEDYLGIQIFRFYYRCRNCSAEFTMKTDPKNLDYEVEHGATRNYEPWRENDRLKEEMAKAMEEEEKGDTMKQLENRTAESKRQMDITNALDEMIALRGRQGKVSTDEALKALIESSKGEEDEEKAAGLSKEDEALVARLMGSRAEAVKRLDEEEEAGPSAGPSSRGGEAGPSGSGGATFGDAPVKAKAVRLRAAPGGSVKKGQGSKLPVMAVAAKGASKATENLAESKGKPPVMAIKRKAKEETDGSEGVKVAKLAEDSSAEGGDDEPLGADGLAGLLGGYGSSGSEQPSP